jgi:hypothetical protein
MCDGGCSASNLLGIAEELSGRALAPRPAAEAGKELVALRRVIDLLELRFARVAAEFAATEEFEAQGSVSPVDWIRHRCRMSTTTAARSVCVGELAGQLPGSVAAAQQGEIGFAHLGLLASTARAVRNTTGSSTVDESTLLEHAKQHSVGRFFFDCAHARHAADAEAFRVRHVDQVEARSLTLSRCEDGMVAIKGLLDSVGGATLRTALQPLSRRTGADDRRLRDRRMADALVALSEHCLDLGVLPVRGGVRPHMQVTTTLETLQGVAGAPAGELEWSPPVPQSTVQRFACDATISRVLLGPGGAVLDVGRAQRVANASQLRGLRARDGGCIWPQCDFPASLTAAHHVVHWAKGGATSLENLVLLCHRHHWLVHEGAWQLVRTEDGRMLPIRPPYLAPAKARSPDTTLV